ncbi:hypothetical protein [Hyphomonas sp.]|uniref:hypothetical protein n=1 Tax=Hyphomonas sp. TaxID=87 RepID=UPI0025C176ED|nr:hypothetical protein [Hyphomonas sp.]
MTLKPQRRLRPGSGRERRLLRLVWLAGWRVAEIAALTGEGERTIRRRLAAFDLMGEEARGEMARLLVAVQQDCVADALAAGGEVKEAVVTHQKMAGTARVMQAAEKEQDSQKTEYQEEEYKEDAIDRLVAMDLALEEAALGSPEGDGERGAFAVETKSLEPVSLPARAPGYAGAAAGPSAHMVAFGGPWRRQDAGGGRMGALGGARGGVSPGGAGGAEPCGGARGDDRGAERPAGDLLGD